MDRKVRLRRVGINKCTGLKNKIEETATWDVTGKREQRNYLQKKRGYIQRTTVVYHSDCPLNSLWAPSSGKFITLLTGLHRNRTPILCMHIQKSRYHSYFFGPLTPYHLTQFKWSDRKFNTWGSGGMVKSLQGECMT